MSKHGRTHLTNHPDVDYAIVLDGGEVAIFMRNTTRQLVPSVTAAEALFGKLEEYKPGKPIPHRPKTALPHEVSLSDQAYALLVQQSAPPPPPVAVGVIAPHEDETPTPPEGTPPGKSEKPGKDEKDEKDDDDAGRHGKAGRRGP